MFAIVLLILSFMWIKRFYHIINKILTKTWYYFTYHINKKLVDNVELSTSVTQVSGIPPWKKKSVQNYANPFPNNTDHSKPNYHSSLSPFTPQRHLLRRDRVTNCHSLRDRRRSKRHICMHVWNACMHAVENDPDLGIFARGWLSFYFIRALSALSSH